MPATPLLFRLTLTISVLMALQAPAFAQRVLVLDDTSGRAEAVLAAERVGLEAAVVQNVAGMVLAYDQDPDWDVLVFDMRRIVFAPALIDILNAHITRGRAAIIAYAEVSGAGELATTLGLTCEPGAIPTPVFAVDPDTNALFSGADRVPSPLSISARTGEQPDLCTPTDTTATVLARYGDAVTGAPAVLAALDGQVLVHTISLDAWAGAGDADDDGTLDVVEVIANGLELVLGARRAGFIVAGDAVPAAVDGWLTRSNRVATHVTTPEALLEALAADRLVDGVLLEATWLPEHDAAWSAAAAAVIAAGLPLVVHGPTQTSAAWAAATGWSATSARTGDAMVRTSGALGALAFTRPQSLEEVGLDGEVDVATGFDGAGAIAIAALTSGATIAATQLDARVVVTGVAFDALAAEDRDADALDDGTEWVENLVSVVNAPARVALVSAPLEGRAAIELENAGYLVVPWALDDPDAASLASRATIDLVVVESNADVLPSADTARTVVDGAAAGDYGLVVYTTLGATQDEPAADGADPWLAALGLVTVAPTDTSAVLRAPFDLSRLFALPQATPRELPLVADAVATGFAPAATASVVATYADGTPAMVSAARGRVIVSGFGPDLLAASDTDGDARPDRAELLVAQWESVQSPQRMLIVDTSDDPVWRDAATLVGLDGVHVTPEDFPSAFDAGGFQLLLVNAVGDSAFEDDALVSRVLLWAEASQGLVVFGTDFDALSAPAAAQLGFTAADTPTLQGVIEPFDGGANVFRSPRVVPSPLNPVANGRADSGDVLTPTGASVIAARYGFNLGPPASLRGPEGTWFMNGFDLLERLPADLDLDGVDDRAALVANQLVAVGRAPVARIDAPASLPEGNARNVSAGQSFDPFDESLTYAWDLTGDGVFNDATGPGAVLDASGFDGPDVLTIAVRVTNESGLSATASQAVTVTNVPPALQLSPSVTVLQGQPYLGRADVIDVLADVPEVVWTFDDGVVLMGLEVVREFDSLGVYRVTVSAADDDGGFDEATQEIRYVNAPPTLDTTGPTEALEGAALAFTATGTDPGDDPFTVQWTFGDGSSADGAEVTHAFVDDGRYTITAVATDTLGATATARREVLVTNVAPVFVSVAPDGATAGSPYVYASEVADPGADRFAYTLLLAPAGMTVDTSGVVRWTPGEGAIRDEAVRLRVEDGDGGSDEQAWVIGVTFVDGDEGGAPDVCESRYGFDVDDSADDTSDPDADGLTVAEECVLGTDPTVYSGPPIVDLISPIGGNAAVTDPLFLTLLNVSDPDGDRVSYDVELASDASMETPVFVRTAVGAGERGRTRVSVDAALVEDATYYWRARAVTETVIGEWSPAAAFRLNRNNRPPGTPTALSPEAFVNAQRPDLVWTNASDPDGDRSTYAVEVITGDALTGELVWSQTDIIEQTGTTQVRMDTPLREGGVYVWRVRARDTTPPFQYGGWSAPLGFVVDVGNGPPETPGSLVPADGALEVPETLDALSWEASADPDGDPVTYTGALAADAAFVSLLTEFETTETRVALDLDARFVPGRTYWWRVSASDGRRTSAVATAAFRIAPSNRAPLAPEIVSPAVGAALTPTDDAPVRLVVANAEDPDGDSGLTYEFVVASDFEMRGEVARETGVAEGEVRTSVAVPSLAADTYFWRARASDGDATGAWSEIRGFTVQGAMDGSGGGLDGPGGGDGSGGDIEDEGAPGAGGCGVAASTGGPAGGPWSVLLVGLWVMASGRRTHRANRDLEFRARKP